jgi:hypothetical protein
MKIEPGEGPRQSPAGDKPKPRLRPHRAQIYQAEVPTDQEHWHYNVDREVRLDKPAKTVFLRYLADPGVNNLRIYAHCLDDSPRPAGKMIITHAWKEEGKLKTKLVTLTKTGPYEITTLAEPTDESITISIPSDQ